MASNRFGVTGLSDSGPSNHHLPYSVHHGINTYTNFINNNQEGSAFDCGELEQAIVLQGLDINNDEALLTGKSAAETLEMFPSWPIKFQQGSSKSGGGESSDSSKSEGQFEPESPGSKKQIEMASNNTTQIQSAPNPPQDKRKGRASTSGKSLDAKTLRRLAQNREAARKSRLRKKAYLQQLETSRIKLTQLEQDLHRASSQGLFIANCGGAGNISSGAAIFDMEYARWLEDDHRHMSELRTAIQARLSDTDLRLIVDSYISHYDEIFQLKATAAKSDVFHLITGLWKTPAERCFLWMAGFRPSQLIKMLIAQLDPLTEQQLMGIYSLQQSSQQAEEALSQGLEQLQQSLVDTIASRPVVDGMQQMAVALGKLANLEGFVRQADNLRQQTLHQLRRILTIRQVARCFLVIGEYYARLRALSSLWASQPRETMMGETTADLQMVHSSHNHFSNFNFD